MKWSPIHRVGAGLLLLAVAAAAGLVMFRRIGAEQAAEAVSE